PAVSRSGQLLRWVRKVRHRKTLISHARGCGSVPGRAAAEKRLAPGRLTPRGSRAGLGATYPLPPPLPLPPPFFGLLRCHGYGPEGGGCFGLSAISITPLC